MSLLTKKQARYQTSGLNVRWVPIDQVVPAIDPNEKIGLGDAQRLAEMIKRSGRFDAIEVKAHDGTLYIEDGNTRYAAAKVLGMQEVPVGDVETRTASLLKKAGIHENASTQINVPKDVADKIIAIGKELIPDEHLAGEGRVEQPHVTVKYGVQPDEGVLQQTLAGRTSFPITLGSTVAFTNSDNNAGGTPVVVEVHGHDLEALHDAVMQAMGTMPDDLPYVPHITIAYVNPDEAQHYVGSDAFTGIKFTAEAVALSPYDDSKQVEVPLAKAAASPAQVTPEIPQVRPQTPQQQQEPEEDEVQRDAPATEQPSVAPQQKQPKAPLLQKQKQPKAPKAPKPPAKNPDFKKWFGKSKVTDSSGKPIVVYHGTTHDFTTFDPSKTTKDSFYGQGLYFTSSKKDLENYAKRRRHRIITRRVEFQSERLMQEWEDQWDDVKDQLGMSQLEEFPAWGTYERDELNEKAKQEAKKEIAGGSGGMSMPVYLSLQNPVIVQKRGGTEFHIDMEEDENGEYTGEESGTGVDLYNAMMLVQGNYESSDAQEIWSDLIGNSGGDFTAYEFEQQVRNGNHEITDDNGDMVMGSFIAEVYQELGFDGIIQDAYAEFGPRPSGYAGGKLPGMTDGSRHEALHPLGPIQGQERHRQRGQVRPAEPEHHRSLRGRRDRGVHAGKLGREVDAPARYDAVPRHQQ